MLSKRAVTTPHDHPGAGDLHAELDRLDRELEQLRARLADEQGALHDARARCRALDDTAPDPDPETNAGTLSGETHEPATLRRVPRTSRLASSRLGSRPERVALRAISGGALPRPRVADLSAARAAAARAAAAAARAAGTDETEPPDAA